MKAIYRRHLQEALDRELPKALPGYIHTPLRLSREERKDATLFAGSRLYSSRRPQGTLYVHLIPHQRQERFHAEVGWSASHRFPVALSSHGPATQPASEFTEPEWLIDFGELYHRQYQVGHLGWEVWRCSAAIDHPDFLRIFIEEDLVPVSEGQARERVVAAVAACVKDLQDVAVPYLGRVAATATRGRGRRTGGMSERATALISTGGGGSGADFRS